MHNIWIFVYGKLSSFFFFKKYKVCFTLSRILFETNQRIHLVIRAFELIPDRTQPNFFSVLGCALFFWSCMANALPVIQNRRVSKQVINLQYMHLWGMYPAYWSLGNYPFLEDILSVRTYCITHTSILINTSNVLVHYRIQLTETKWKSERTSCIFFNANRKNIISIY